MAEIQVQVVWVQLYIGKAETGRAFSIAVDSLPNHNVDDLTTAVKEKCPNVLAHCDAFQLTVYNPGGEFPKEDDKLSPGKPVPTNTTDENPLRVVAQAGKNT